MTTINLTSNLFDRSRQMSESFILSAFLAFSGGFQDAYTYIVRNHVFANAQTGNIVLMSTHLMNGEWVSSLKYLLPLLAFAAGVFSAEQIEGHLKNLSRLHWRQLILLMISIALFITGFMPDEYYMAANILVSFSCAIQVQSFRKVAGNAYASTMCIGNLRSGTSALSDYVRSHNKKSLIKFRYYYGIILIFAIGAGVGGNLSKYLGRKSIWICLPFLAIAYLLMMIDSGTPGKSH